MDDKALYVISVAADLAGMHAQTLRIYEREGLLEPSRTPGGNRRYSESDVAMLRRIKELSESGVSREGIRMVLDLEARLTQSMERIAQLEEIIERARISFQREAEEIRKSYRYEIVPFRGGSLTMRYFGGHHGS